MTTFTRNGVRAERLRAGTQETLFIVPGLEGDPSELAGLVSTFTGPQQVYALAPLLTDALQEPISSVERMAELMVALVLELSPSGPYRLSGYSFGALVAIEMAQQLHQAGHTVDALLPIEAIYDERFWPRRIWLRALARRTNRHLIRIAHMHPTMAAAELRMRGHRLIGRIVRRRQDGQDSLTAVDGGTAMSNRARTAMAAYRPRFYDGGPLTLITASNDRHFGCDIAELWAGYFSRLHVQRVTGDHLTILTEPESAAAVAKIIDHRLALNRTTWNGLTPMPGFERPMILSTMRWFSAARLGHALSEAGFSVSACRPKGHPLELVDALTTDRRLHKLWPLRSIAAAIRSANPDLIVCDDERALALLRRLYVQTQATDPGMAELLARSLGNVEDWPSITSRAGLADEARALNVAAPETAVIDDESALATWVAEHNLPVVLKTDGSWGGDGVAIVRNRSSLHRAWRKVSSPPGLVRALKRAVFDRDLYSLVARLRREHPVVNAQQFCAGREAIVTAACVDGKVQSLVCVEVDLVSEARGPAAVVRVIDHPQMTDTAIQLIRRFRLSGFYGFDFAVADCGNAQLLEFNPRVTPTCHLLVEGDCRPGRVVALFPFDQVRDLDPGVEVLDILDIPVRAPLLVERGRKLSARRDRPVPRAMRHLKRKFSEFTSDAR